MLSATWFSVTSNLFFLLLKSAKSWSLFPRLGLKIPKLFVLISLHLHTRVSHRELICCIYFSSFFSVFTSQFWISKLSNICTDFLLPVTSFGPAFSADVNFCYSNFMISICVYAATGSGINNTMFGVLSSNEVVHHISNWVSMFCTIFSDEVSHGCCPCCSVWQYMHEHGVGDKVFILSIKFYQSYTNLIDMPFVIFSNFIWVGVVKCTGLVTGVSMSKKEVSISSFTGDSIKVLVEIIRYGWFAFTYRQIWSITSDEGEFLSQGSTLSFVCSNLGAMSFSIRKSTPWVDETFPLCLQSTRYMILYCFLWWKNWFRPTVLCLECNFQWWGLFYFHI